MEEMRLVFAGKELEDDRIVGDYHIQHGNITSLIITKCLSKPMCACILN